MLRKKLLICSGLLLAGAASAELSDPMRPARLQPTPQAASVETVKPDLDRWRLNSTLVSGARRVAVINDELVGVGDRIDGAVVVVIAARSAILRYSGRELTLSLGRTHSAVRTGTSP